MEKRWCSACGEAFEPRPQSPRQSYCPKPDCQQARKRLWQRTKRRTDDDYRNNQHMAQDSWRCSHPGYWREYREAHPAYVALNRLQQRQRNAAHRANGSGPIAKGDASARHLPPAGIFMLTQLSPGCSADPRVWTVHLAVLAAA